MTTPFHCVMFDGQPLTDDLRSYLYRLACAMLRDGNKRKKINHATAVGTVQNNNKSARLGSYSGESFTAELETEDGRTTVHYLVSRHNHREYAAELPKGKWVSRVEIISGTDPSEN